MELFDFLLQYKTLDIVSDSRRADSNCIFVALKGSKFDGHNYIENVYKQGCRHFIVENNEFFKNKKEIHYLTVKDTSVAWAKAWKFKSENPDQSLFLVGITGTNGKTSITMMIEHILNFCGYPCGVMGTIDHHLKLNGQNYVWDTNLTTPGADILYPRLQQMKSYGAKAVALEISSHALDQNRAKDLNLNSAVFSNFTTDHLDYHQTLENYFSSKLKLFDDLLSSSTKKNRISVLNYNDTSIGKFLPSFGDVEILFEMNSLDSLSTNRNLADLFYKLKTESKIKSINSRLNLVCLKKQDLHGLLFSMVFDYNPETSNQIVDFELPILGHFQMLNWSQAILSLKSKDLHLDQIKKAGLVFRGVPGRLQKVLNTKSKSIFIDYAHTPDALERVLQSLRQVCQGRLGVVFGCGGDRDTSKRSLMGRVAEEYSDFQILTSDNPRSEEPNQIIKDILVGFKNDIKNKKLSSVLIEPDRKSAILLGFAQLKDPQDVLLIAGKGHENYQILKDKTIQFSDEQVVLEILENH